MAAWNTGAVAKLVFLGVALCVGLVLFVIGTSLDLITNRDELHLVGDYNVAVGNYQNNGGINLSGQANGTVSVSSLPECLPVLRVSSSADYIPSQLASSGVFSYTEVQLVGSCAAAVKNWTVNAANVNQAPAVSFAVTVATGTAAKKQFVFPAVPLWTVSSGLLSSHGTLAAAAACRAKGGYVSTKATGTACVLVAVLSGICGKLTVVGSDPREWSISTSYGGPGCSYPFTNVATYAPVSFLSGAANVSIMSLPVNLISDDDPSVYLGDVTMGTGLFATAVIDRTITGNTLIVVGLLLIVAAGCGALIVRGSAAAAPTASAAQKPAESHSTTVALGFAVAAISLMLGVGGGVPIAALQNMQQLMKAVGMLGVWLMMLGIPVGTMVLFQTWRVLIASPALGRGLKQAGLISSGVVLIAACSALIAGFVIPWTCSNSNLPVGAGFEEGGCHITFEMGFDGFTSLMVTFTLAPAGLWCLYQAATLPAVTMKPTAASGHADGSNERLLHSPVKDSGAAPIPGRIAWLSTLFLFPALFIASMLFPPIWNIPMIGYAAMTSKYAVGFLKLFGPLNNPLAATGNTNYISFKLYPDTIGFYGFLAALMVAGIVGTRVAAVRRVAKIRFPVTVPWVWKGFLCVGEVVLSVAFTALCAWWFYYWTFAFERIGKYGGNIGYTPVIDPQNVCGYDPNGVGTDDTTDSAMADLCYSELKSMGHGNYVFMQGLARGIGHVANLLLAFTVFPVSRNSMWEHVFGVPFERALFFHRILGIGFYGFATLHLLFWVIFWAQEGVLSNLVAIIGCDIVPNAMAPHCDNFTVPVMVIIWVLMSGMIALAVWSVRRNRFEWFYYAHHVFILVFIGGLLHAWCFWMYAGGPILLWWLDRYIRLTRGCTPMHVATLRYEAHGHTAVVLRPRVGTPKFDGGQYAFLNVPAVSKLQWHPFSISSGPTDGTYSFHIKDMGPGTWTHDLATFAKTVADNPASVEVYMDGPYGKPSVDYLKHQCLLLVAGGVGVTPMHSILRDLHARVLEGDNSWPTSVVFLWTVREADAIDMLADSLRDVQARNPGRVFKLELYATRSTASDSMDGLVIKRGRPPTAQLLTELIQEAGGDKSKVAVLVCGPDPMVESTSQLAYEQGVPFHSETFAF